MRSDRPATRAIGGPIVLITVGGLFVLQNFYDIGFGKTWPVLLIVIGLLGLRRRAARPAPPPQNWLPGGYRPPYAQSPYAPPGAPAQGAAHQPGEAPASGAAPAGDQTPPGGGGQ